MYDYRVKVLRVVDGDTLHVTVDLGFDQRVDKSLRLYGINCPEMNTPEGVAAKAFVEKLVSRVTFLRTVKDRREKYGRYLGTLYDSQWKDLNQEIIEAGHAVSYMVS